ncbi:TPA: hypothetical protein QDZ23_004872 [Pseudomonas putida]|nr:hypothetical protein [Pseudomonas putida]
MDINKMREQFEAAAESQGLSIARTQQALRFANGTSRAAGDYVELETLCAWWAWQASREDVVVELPGIVRAYPHSCADREEYMWPEEVREAIEAQGLRWRHD